MSDTLAYTSLVWPTETRVGVRVQLKKAGHSGKWGPIYVNYKKSTGDSLITLSKACFHTTQKLAILKTGTWISIPLWEAKATNTLTLTTRDLERTKV